MFCQQVRICMIWELPEIYMMVDGYFAHFNTISMDIKHFFISRGY